MDQLVLKSQDVAILVKLLGRADSSWRQVDIAYELDLSQGEIAKALVRLQKAALIHNKQPNRAAALEFLIHAVKYVFPAELGPLSFGVPTAISAKVHSTMVMSQEDTFVWPHQSGKKRGQSVTPLYPKLADAALKDEQFYEVMAAIEILRLGRARERKRAEMFLQRRLKHA